jgi:hypothetical protein
MTVPDDVRRGIERLRELYDDNLQRTMRAEFERADLCRRVADLERREAAATPATPPSAGPSRLWTRTLEGPLGPYLLPIIVLYILGWLGIKTPDFKFMSPPRDDVPALFQKKDPESDGE